MSAPGVIRSYAEANRELVAAFGRYFTSKGNAPRTLQAYNETLTRLTEFLGSRSLADVDRVTIREFLQSFFSRGVSPHTLERHTAGLRAFFKFVRLAGLGHYDPTLLLPHRKLPRRLPRVLTIADVEQLIAAARNPFERAVPEVLYSTGVRVSELVNLRLEDIQWGVDGSQLSSVRIHRGKGGKDRIVLFGRKAADAIREYQKAFPSQTGFLFEAAARKGFVYRVGGSWIGKFYVNKVQHSISLLATRRRGDRRTARIARTSSHQEAERELARITSQIPDFHPHPPHPYSKEAIRNVLNRLAHRAGLGRVHPHALRRAFASHFLQSGSAQGVDLLRPLQELLGHTNLTTTMLYTHLTAENLKSVHQRAHPHEQGGTDAEKN